MAAEVGPDSVFRVGDDLYVLVEAESRSLQLARNKAAALGRILIAEYIGQGELRLSRPYRQSVTERGRGQQKVYTARVIMKMPWFRSMLRRNLSS
jgi:hypothetical protein